MIPRSVRKSWLPDPRQLNRAKETHSYTTSRDMISYGRQGRWCASISLAPQAATRRPIPGRRDKSNASLRSVCYGRSMGYGVPPETGWRRFSGKPNRINAHCATHRDLRVLARRRRDGKGIAWPSGPHMGLRWLRRLANRQNMPANHCPRQSCLTLITPRRDGATRPHP